MNTIQLDERRKHHALRAIFDDARVRIEKFFLPDSPWAGESVDYLARRVMRESYPDMTAGDIQILVGAIARRCAPAGA